MRIVGSIHIPDVVVSGVFLWGRNGLACATMLVLKLSRDWVVAFRAATAGVYGLLTCPFDTVLLVDYMTYSCDCEAGVNGVSSGRCGICDAISRDDLFFLLSSD